MRTHPRVLTTVRAGMVTWRVVALTGAHIKVEEAEKDAMGEERWVAVANKDLEREILILALRQFA